MSAALAVDEVEIAVQLQAKGPAHCQELLKTLRDKGYTPAFG
jgi:hypothetical protein